MKKHLLLLLTLVCVCLTSSCKDEDEAAPDSVYMYSTTGTVDAAAGTHSVTIFTTCAWTAAGDTWITVNPVAGGEKGIIVLDKTPFYAEMGGQIADQGVILMGNSRFVVSDVQKDKGGKYLHHGKMVTGSIKVDDIVVASIDVERRKAIMRAHSATHLLQKALQTVLGDHVHQAGSYVEPDRLRFDFTHYSALTPEELVKVNAIVQNSILEGYNIVTREMPVDEAKAMGATALFSEKYGSTVRVVNMGNYSIELCGGTHLDNTAKVGPFEIESECSVASGVRRIEAITGKACLERMERNQTMLLEAAAKLKTKPIELGTRIQAQLEELRELRRTIEAYKAKETVGEIDRILFGSHNVDGLKVITASVPNADTGRLRQMGDVLRDKDASVVAGLATVNEGKITFLAVCGKDAIARGIKAGDLVKQVCCCCGGFPDSLPAGRHSGGCGQRHRPHLRRQRRRQARLRHGRRQGRHQGGQRPRHRGRLRGFQIEVIRKALPQRRRLFQR